GASAGVLFEGVCGAVSAGGAGRPPLGGVAPAPAPSPPGGEGSSQPDDPLPAGALGAGGGSPPPLPATWPVSVLATGEAGATNGALSAIADWPSPLSVSPGTLEKSPSAMSRPESPGESPPFDGAQPPPARAMPFWSDPDAVASSCSAERNGAAR